VETWPEVPVFEQSKTRVCINAQCPEYLVENMFPDRDTSPKLTTANFGASVVLSRFIVLIRLLPSQDVLRLLYCGLRQSWSGFPCHVSA